MTKSQATSRWSPLIVFCVLTLLVGCASLGPQLPMPMTDDTEPDDVTLRVRTLGSDGEFELLSSGDLARQLQTARGERPLSILVLSSGGASGAFGAGALVGWTSRGTRPEFAVVTGVSAGALVAPLAFLGPSWDGRMTAIFTTGVTDGLLQSRGLGALFGTSVYSAEPLRRLIQQYADDAMIDAIAREAAKGRLLLVATTDFATGDAVIWDLGSIALYGGKNAKPLFQAVLLASASVPGMLPPVVMKVRTKAGLHEETHVDGGVTLPFFIAPAPEDLAQATAASAQPAVVHVIIDGPLRDTPRRTHANALSVFTRSLAAGLSHITRTELEFTVAAVHQHGISLDYAAIPASYPLRGNFDFGADSQRSLFEFAARCAETERLWVPVHSASNERAARRPAPSETELCPADDAFIERLAALGD
jgi:predicted acylesterase/phospholipase RssA